jgi:hypothetical protein
MALAVGSRVIPRSLVGVSLTNTGILAQPILVGYVTDIGGGTAGDVLWSNGLFDANLDITDATVQPVLEIAKSAPSTVSSYSGRVVALTNRSPEMTGIVLMVCGLELVPQSATFVDIVIVKGIGPSQAYWIALVSAVSIVDDQ